MSDKTKARLWMAALLFLDLAAAAALALLLGSGTSQPSGWLFLGIAVVLLLISLLLAFSLRYTHIRSLGLHGALFIGSVLFMFPFVWLVITSFKYPEEVVSYPPKWVPAVPMPMTHSPYVTAELHEAVERPNAIDKARWKTLWPRIETVVWEHARVHVSQQYRDELDEKNLRQVLVQALWNSLMAGVPLDVWKQGDEVLLQTLQQRVTKGRVADVWNTIFRCVAVREPFVTDLERIHGAPHLHQ